MKSLYCRPSAAARAMRDIRLVKTPFIPGTLIGPFAHANPGLGGICTFVGEIGRAHV